MNRICQKCYRSEKVLKALGKYKTVESYPQCSDCCSDLEFESIVIRQIHFDIERIEGISIPEWLFKDLYGKGLLVNVKTHKNDIEDYDCYKEMVAERFAESEEGKRTALKDKKSQIKSIKSDIDKMEEELV